VFGHTHRPFSQILDGIHFLNPGSAGAPRHGLPASVCLLHLDSPTPRPELIDLQGRPLAF
jgi:predicted phosphodiesterase